MPCKNGFNPTSPNNQLKRFKTIVGEISVLFVGTGSRDIDFTTSIAEMGFTIPLPIISVYMYWNVICGKTVHLSKAAINGTTVHGKEIGWCGNTMWTKNEAENTGGLKPFVKSNIINKVYRANVTGLVASGVYDIEIKRSKPDPSTAGGVDNPHYPGCKGSQGIVFVFILSDPCPSESNPIGDRKFILHNGAVLLAPPNAAKKLGGKSSFSVPFSPGRFTQAAAISTGVGDAQTEPADALSWNGVDFPSTGGSYFVPNCGNLLFVGDEPLAGYDVKTKNNHLRASTSSDALCWFLAGYIGTEICCAYDPKPTPTRALKDQLTFFKGFLGNVDYTFAGVGIRDINTNITPVNLAVTVPGDVIKAYLYWNVIGAGDWEPFRVIFDGRVVEGCLVGWCGNTCWADCCDCDGIVPEGIPRQLTVNKVFRADVTDIVGGTGSYSLRIPTQNTTDCVLETLDLPHLPNCHSGQGVVLLVVYKTEPEITTKDGCCPGHKSSFIVRKQILISDGAVLLTGNSLPGRFGGGTPIYSATVTTQYNTNIKILTGVGDAQTDLPDELFWDGVPFPTNIYGSYFDPNCGNLLHLKQEVIGGSKPCKCSPVTHAATATTPVDGDCLCWFLFVYYGELKCVNVKMISPPVRIRAVGC